MPRIEIMRCANDAERKWNNWLIISPWRRPKLISLRRFRQLKRLLLPFRFSCLRSIDNTKNVCPEKIFFFFPNLHSSRTRASRAYKLAMASTLSRSPSHSPNYRLERGYFCVMQEFTALIRTKTVVHAKWRDWSNDKVNTKWNWSMNYCRSSDKHFSFDNRHRHQNQLTRSDNNHKNQSGQPRTTKRS